MYTLFFSILLYKVPNFVPCDKYILHLSCPRSSCVIVVEDIKKITVYIKDLTCQLTFSRGLFELVSVWKFLLHPETNSGPGRKSIMAPSPKMLGSF